MRWFVYGYLSHPYYPDWNTPIGTLWSQWGCNWYPDLGGNHWVTKPFFSNNWDASSRIQNEFVLFFSDIFFRRVLISLNWTTRLCHLAPVKQVVWRPPVSMDQARRMTGAACWTRIQTPPPSPCRCWSQTAGSPAGWSTSHPRRQTLRPSGTARQRPSRPVPGGREKNKNKKEQIKI